MSLYLVKLSTDAGPLYHSKAREAWTSGRAMAAGFCLELAIPIARRHHADIERADGEPLRLVVRRGRVWLTFDGLAWCEIPRFAQVFGSFRIAETLAQQFRGRIEEAVPEAGKREPATQRSTT